MNILIEEWKDIFGYEGMFQISSFGRVKSLIRIYVKKEKIMMPNKNRDGYYLIGFSDKLSKRKHKTYSIHRLVATHFIPNPNNLRVINHIDFNKTPKFILRMTYPQYELCMKHIPTHFTRN